MDTTPRYFLREPHYSPFRDDAILGIHMARYKYSRHIDCGELSLIRDPPGLRGERYSIVLQLGRHLCPYIDISGNTLFHHGVVEFIVSGLGLFHYHRSGS